MLLEQKVELLKKLAEAKDRKDTSLDLLTEDEEEE